MVRKVEVTILQQTVSETCLIHNHASQSSRMSPQFPRTILKNSGDPKVPYRKGAER